ncbi:hypothetical protein [Streptomyces phaeoluteigriseus]
MIATGSYDEERLSLGKAHVLLRGLRTVAEEGGPAAAEADGRTVE